MLWGFVAVVAAAAACNVVLTSVTGGAFFKVGFAAQPIAHTDALWNVLGLFLAGFAAYFWAAARCVSWCCPAKATPTAQ